jgi:hypothetical protein
MPGRMQPAPVAHFCPYYAPYAERECSRRSCRNRGAQAGHCVINIFQNKQSAAKARVGAYTSGMQYQIFRSVSDVHVFVLC